MWKDRAGLLERCLDRLSEGLREVCDLYYFDNLRTKDIATRLGINTATVRKRMERARDTLRVCIDRLLGLSKIEEQGDA